MVKQYETWMANLNPRVGTEAGKIRPVVIIQTNFLNELHPSTIVCPFTSQVELSQNPLRVTIIPNKANGLVKNSDIMVDQIRTVDNKRLIKKIGALDQTAINALRENLKIVMDL